MLAGATSYLRLFAYAAGGCMLAEEALAAARGANGAASAGDRIGIARFFAENMAVQAGGLEVCVTQSAESVTAATLPDPTV